MQEIRCKNCGRLLGRFGGIGEIKCPRCGAVNVFDTGTGEIRVTSVEKHINLSVRKTSSGVTFR